MKNVNNMVYRSTIDKIKLIKANQPRQITRHQFSFTTFFLLILSTTSQYEVYNLLLRKSTRYFKDSDI